MTFVALQEALRKQLRKRIEAGELTGMELARRTGFTQAHISNFLNRKRGLKLGALDRALRAMGLSLYDLLDPHELARFAAAPAEGGPGEAGVPLVSGAAAASREVIVREDVREMAGYPRALLERIRADAGGAARRGWTRFVALEATPEDAAAMAPRFAAGARLLVDRHYATLQPYRKGERNIYAVRRDGNCVVRYVEPAGEWLLLRPHHPESPVELIAIAAGQATADLLAGRVAHIATEA